MINIKLKDFQERAVDFLFETTTNSNSKPKIVVQSPTGSGKTIVGNIDFAYSLIDKVR